MNRHALRTITVLTMSALTLALTGCGESKPAPTAKGTAAENHGHAHGSGGEHQDHAKPAPAPDDDHGHGVVVQLGEQQVAGFTVRASRDGKLEGASDSPIDVWITGGTGKVKSVRFWVGTEDAKGSVKAKAELERDNWHTHAELPSPMPADSKLWVEFEVEGGGKQLVGFDLKA
jgi:hypothetical protein